MTAFLASCSKVEWSDQAPEEIVGLWHETSDWITSGVEEPSAFKIEKGMVTYAMYIPEDKNHRIFDLPIQKTNEEKGKIRIFCGQVDSSHIANRRFEFSIEENPMFVYVREIVATGYGDDDAYFEIGRFVRKDH